MRVALLYVYVSRKDLEVPRHMQTRDILSLKGNDVIDVVFVASQ